MPSLRVLLPWAASLPALTVSGCAHSQNSVADPFSGGLANAHVVVDTVDCDPTPTTCTRYVVLRPVGVSQTALLAKVRATATTALGWTPARYPEVIESDEGNGYDGTSADSGGTINTSKSELHYWNRVGYADGQPRRPRLDAVLAAMRSTPDGVVVRISED